MVEAPGSGDRQPLTGIRGQLELMEGIGKVKVGVVFEASDLLEFLADIRDDVLGNVDVLVDAAVVATNTEERCESPLGL